MELRSTLSSNCLHRGYVLDVVDVMTVPLTVLSWRTANCRCQVFDRRSHYLQKIQCFVKVLQSCSTLCTESCRVMSPLVTSYIMQIIP